MRAASFSVSFFASAGGIWARMAARICGFIWAATGRRTRSSSVAMIGAASFGFIFS